MIKTTVKHLGRGVVSQDLELQGRADQLLYELTALVTGILSGMKLQEKWSGDEMSIEERIDLFCDLLKEEEKMTNEQKNQVAAMNASGMSIDEILLDTKLPRAEVEAFVAEREKKKSDLSTFTVVEIKKKSGRGHPISAQTKQAIIEWYQSGHKVAETAKKFGVDPKTVKAAVGLLPKEKEPAPASTETSSEVSDKADNNLQVHNITENPKSQALRGVEVIGLMQTMLISVEENFGDNVDIISLRADSEQAHLMFRYGGTDYVLSFGLAF